MPKLISLSQIVGRLFVEGAPQLNRMVPVQHFDSTHVWVWKATQEGIVVGPIKMKHSEVSKAKKKLAAPSSPFHMIGKIDPYEYVSKKDVYSLDWKSGDPKSKDLVPLLGVLGKNGMLTDDEYEQPPADVPGFEADGQGPDEDGWIDGEYKGVEAHLSPDKTHILDFYSREVLWPEARKPKVSYGIPNTVGPSGHIDKNGFVVYVAHDPEGLKLSLLPSGKLASLVDGKYIVHTRDFDGEMIQTTEEIPESQVLQKKKTPAVEPPPAPAPAPAPEPAPEPEPTDLTPEDLKFTDQPNIYGMRHALLPGPMKLAKDPTGGYWLLYGNDYVEEYTPVKWTGAWGSADKESSWSIDMSRKVLSVDEISKINKKFAPKAAKTLITPQNLKFSEEPDEYGTFPALSPADPTIVKDADGTFWIRGGTTFIPVKWIGTADATEGDSWDKDPDRESIPFHKMTAKNLPSTGDVVSLSDIEKLSDPDPETGVQRILSPASLSAVEMFKLPTGEYALWQYDNEVFEVFSVKEGGDPADVNSWISSGWTTYTKEELKKKYASSVGELPGLTSLNMKDLAGFPLYKSSSGVTFAKLPGGIAIFLPSLGKYKFYKQGGFAGNFVPDKTKELVTPQEATASSVSSDYVYSTVNGQLKNGFFTLPSIASPAGPHKVIKVHHTDGSSDNYDWFQLPNGVIAEYDSLLNQYYPAKGSGKSWTPNKVIPISVAEVLAMSKSSGPGSVLIHKDHHGFKLSKTKDGVEYSELPAGLLGIYKPSHETYQLVELGDDGTLYTVGQKTKAPLPEIFYAGVKVLRRNKPIVGEWRAVGVDDNGALVLARGKTKPGLVRLLPTGMLSKLKGKYAEASFSEDTGKINIVKGGELIPQLKVKIAAPKKSSEYKYTGPGAIEDEPDLVSMQTGEPLLTTTDPNTFTTYTTSAVDFGSYWHVVEPDSADDKLLKAINPELIKVRPDENSNLFGWSGFWYHKEYSLILRRYSGSGSWYIWYLAEGNWEKGPKVELDHLGVVTALDQTTASGSETGGYPDLSKLDPSELFAPAQNAPAAAPVWNPPSEFTVATKWKKFFKANEVKAHGYNIQPLDYSGSSEKLQSMASKGDLYLTPSGSLIAPKAYTKGTLFHPLKISPQGDVDFLPPKSAEDLGIAPAQAPLSAVVPTAAKPAEISIPSAPKASAAAVEAPVISSKLPAVGDLSFAKSGAAMKGAGKKDVYKDKQGNEYLFKPALSKSGDTIEPFRAYTQEVSSAIAISIRPDHIPIKAVELNGQIGTVQPILALGNPSDLSNYPPTKLTDQEKLDVATEHVIDWLGSQHDSHKANLVRTADGRVLSIDKEQGFKYWGDDKLSTDYHPNAKYGENEPYYNTFWKAFADGSIDFDPMKMSAAITAAQSSDWAAIEVSLRKYAEQKHPGDAYAQEAFIAEARSRHNTVKQDFEKFITDQYEKRTGDKGKFTFSSGWVAKGAKHFKTVSTDIAAWADGTEKVVSLPVKDAQVPISVKIRKHENDSTLVTLKVSHASEYISGLTQLKKVLDELHIDQVGDAIQGSQNVMVFVKKADLESVGVHEKQIEVTEFNTILPHAGKAEYLPVVDNFSAADPNFVKLDKISSSKDLGVSGKRIFLDTDVVENQTATVKRIKRSGEYYTMVQMKLRSPYPSYLKGTAVDYHASQGAYGAKDDALDQTGGSNLLTKFSAANCMKVTSGKDIMYGFTDSQKYAMRGVVIAEIHGSGGEIVSRLKPLFEKLIPSVTADRILTEPTDQDRIGLKAWRLLNALDPKKHDQLLSAKSTTEQVIDHLKKKKWLDKLTAVREVDVLNGYMGHVHPGRWKEETDVKGQPLLRYFFHATNNASAIPAVLRNGLASGTERIYQGTPKTGALGSSDFESGGADTVQFRVSVASTSGEALYIGSVPGRIRFIYSPDIADRLDCIFYKGDTFGCTNPNSSSFGDSYKSRVPFGERLRQFSNAGGWDSAEAVFVRGVHSKKCLRVACDSDQLRDQVLNECYLVNMREHNGVPIEDFVVVETAQGPVYDKYVKPAGY